jgi:hypothetical protein
MNKNSFCLKLKSSCKISSHTQATFDPDLDHYYINKNQNADSAWCDFKLSKVNAEHLQQQGIDFQSSKSIEDWKFIFSSSRNLPSEAISDMDRAIQFMKDPIKIGLAMKTPGKQKLQRAISSDDKIVEQLVKIEASTALLHLTQAEKDEWITIVPEDLISYIENLSDITKNLFTEIEDVKSSLKDFATLSDVSSDLTDVSSALTGLKLILGNNKGSVYPDVWTAINDLSTEQSNTLTLNEISDKQEHLMKTVTALRTLTTSYGERWNALGTNWLPLIQNHQNQLDKLMQMRQSKTVDMDSMLNHGIKSTSQHPSSSGSLSDKKEHELKTQISYLESRLNDLESSIKSERSVSFQPPSPTSTPNRDAFGFGSSGVSFKQYYFPDETAIKKWMKDNLSSPSHGLFVDLVSFTQFFGDDSYVERNVTLNDLYMSNKIGYQSMADAYVATSFENVLPAAYGRNVNSSPNKASSNADMDSQPELPGLPSFEKWDHTDGGTGRKYWISKECRKTGIQIDGMIRAQLHGVAQYLAKDLLTESIAMSEALFTFISTSYQDTFNSGRFDTKQAWQLTCKFVKRIFVELGDVRITARAGIHIDDPWTSAAKFLFATLRAHEVMHSFMRLDIKNHPSISSEMVKFICYSQPASDTTEVLGRLNSAESMQRTHQSNISKLELKSKKMDTWKADTDKLLKKLKDKAEIA